MTNAQEPYDLDQPRRLEIRLRTERDFSKNGLDLPTERSANAQERYTADVMALMRGFVENDGRLVVNVASLEGFGLTPIAPSALFHLWLSFTSHVAGMKVDPEDTQAVRQAAFLQKVLMLLQLDQALAPLEDALAAEATPAAASTPPEPSSPPDDAPPSSG